MDIEIAEVSATEDGAVYVVARFWWTDGAREKGAPPDLVNDFVMPHLKPTVTRVVRDEKGWPVTTRGQAIDPATITPESRHSWARETVDGDVRGQIMRNVLRFAKGASGKRGDERSRSMRRLQSEPKRILEREDVKALRESVTRVAETETRR